MFLEVTPYFMSANNTCEFVFLHIMFDQKCILTESTNVSFLLERDGTTDVTRTMHFGTPTAYEKVQSDRDLERTLSLLGKALLL